MSSVQQILNEGRNKEITFLRIGTIHDAIQKAPSHFNKNTTIFDCSLGILCLIIYL